jgi:16S rRNA (adenine1518-N6/adenine1519-N6)-dimethyltransferase
LRAKKSYGQHFLKNERIARRIAQSLRPDEACRRVLEVGPGKGMLTRFLLDLPIELIAVEADADMVDYLHAHFPKLSGKVVLADFLQLDLDGLFAREQFCLIGNFPYNISSQIVFKMLTHRHRIPELVGMFQREVAERIIAPPGDKTYGIISVLTQAYYEGALLFGVDRGMFSPPPKVQSAVIRLSRRQSPLFRGDEALFRQVVKQAFGQRRKMLRNTLKNFFSDPAVLQETFFNQRPEQLSVEDYVSLTQRIVAQTT